MAIYRGPGGSGDATNDASSEALITVQAKDAALVAQAAAEAAQASAETAASSAATSATTAASNVSTALSSGTNSASLTTLTTSGNVGIGTSSPRAKLDINGVGVFGTTGATNNPYITVQSDESSNTVGFDTSASVAYPAITFKTSAVERMRLDASGNLGIGTAAPTAKLDVNGNVVASSAKSGSGSVTAASATPVTIFTSTTGLYQVYAYVGFSGAPTDLTASATVMNDGNGARIVSNNGTNLTITLSSLNVQVIQTSATSQIVSYTFLKLA